MKQLNVIVFGSLLLFFTGCSRTSLEQRIAELPNFPYKVAPFIAAASDLQATGQQTACNILMRAATKDKDGWQLIVLCRMLFTNDPEGIFRPGGICAGAATFLGDTDYTDWPRNPIEVLDGVPFLVVTRWSLTGPVETTDHYLSYCMSNCVWNSQRFVPKSHTERMSALTKLIASPKWRRSLNAGEKEFLTSQIK